jgi:hypothetical protein
MTLFKISDGKPTSPGSKIGELKVVKAKNAPLLAGGTVVDTFWEWNGSEWIKTTRDKVEQTTGTSAYTQLGSPSFKPDRAVRYPRNIAANVTDYVLFQFYDYVPPYKNKDKSDLDNNGTSLSAYNWSVADADQYKETTAKSIILYMPEDLSTGYKAGWTGKNISSVGASALATAGSTGFGGDSNAVDQIVNGFGEAWDRLGPITGAKVVQGVVSKVSGESLELNDVFGATRGVILNPNSELLFNGLDMRNFSLSYKLVPRNEKEAADIKEICKIFKTAMLPKSSPAPGTFPVFEGLSINQGTGIKVGFISVPNLCRVSFMRGAKLNSDVTQYKMCAITQVDINYTPDGAYATHTDGSMVAIGLTLSFQETKLVYAEEAWAY